MVQGSSSFDRLSSRISEPTWDKTSKKSGYEAIQKQQELQRKREEERKYGAWGSTFKNKEHFANMHCC